MSQQTGSNRNAQGSSLSALISTLAPIFVGASVAFLAFLFLRRRYDRVYVPRTYLSTLDKSQLSPKPASSLLGWISSYTSIQDEHVLAHSSLDNYLWLRFFKMLAVMSFVGCLITWPVLFPIAATGGGGETGIDILSFSNVNGVGRYFAFAIMSWVFLGFAMFLISRETILFVNLRQAYLLSPYSVSRISSRTVLFVDVPEYYRNEKHIRETMRNVNTVWLTHDPEDLADKVDDQTDAIQKLEKAETKLIAGSLKQHAKKQKKNKNEGTDGPTEDDVRAMKRPTHRLKPLIGKKVDTIDWARRELHDLASTISRDQHEFRQSGAKESAIFVEFETVAAAQIAFQQVMHQQPLHFTAKEIGMTPDMVNWDNVTLPWWNVKLKTALGTAFMAFLCLFWTIPVAFVGVLTNVNYLTDTLPWLSFINSIPQQIMGVVTGLLPVLLLAILMKLVPIIGTAIATTFEPTQKAVQMRVQSWYFAFEVIQVFLITTFTSGASAVVSQVIQDPLGAPQLLAKNLPKASTFYICYFILFGLATAAMQILNIMPLLFCMILGKVLDKTPRKKYNRSGLLDGIKWAVFYPKYTNLGVIALAHSCIAPLVLGFATVGFTLLYLAFRYNVIYTLGTTVDTRGEAYARALQQLTVGIYLSEFCLIGLFAIGVGDNRLSLGPLILEIILFVATILYHMQFRKAMGKLVVSLPGDLLAEETRNKHGDGELEKGDTLRHDRNLDVQRPATGSESSDTTVFQVPQSAAPPPKQSGIAGKVKEFFFPSTYASAAVLSKHVLSPHLARPVRTFTQREREEAYMHPALRTDEPVVWVARDEYGLSWKEVQESRRVIGEGVNVTNQGARFDEKGSVALEEGYVAPASVNGSRRITGGYDLY
ncbi:phosphate metabolism protein 7 [Oleoguttula sp. CCFEE 5521]